MKILGFLPDPGGCGFYRMRQPLTWMKYAGHEVEYFLPADLMNISTKRTTLLRGAEAVLVQRMASIEMMEMLRDYCPDAVIAFDLDDFYWGLPWENQARMSINEARLMELSRALARADVVIASTPYLQEQLRRFHPRVELVRNAIDPTWVRESRPENPCLRIGWAGSVTHRVDLEPMIKGLRMAMNALPDAAAIFMGAESQAIARELDPKRTYFHDPVIMDHYPIVLGRLNLDIGLAPIREHEFNRAKSEVKWLEYSAAGAATVASRVGPYAEAIQDYVTGVLVRHHDPYEWRDAIIELGRNEVLRNNLARNAQAEILRRNSAPDWCAKLAAILIEIKEEGRQGNQVEKGKPKEKKVSPLPGSPGVFSGSPGVPSVTVAVLNWVPEPGPRLDVMVECLPRILARCEELSRAAAVEVVIRDQGSCAEATMWALEESRYWRARGLRVAVESTFLNRGIQVLNEIAAAHPADFLLKIDNDVLIPPGALPALLKTWEELDAQVEMGMLGLDVAWQNNETFALREKGKCASINLAVREGEVTVMKPNSVVIGQCRLERMDRLAEIGGYPSRMYGTDQPNADAYSNEGYTNAHLLYCETGPDREVRPRPLIHKGVEEAENVMEFKREELKKAVGIS